MHLRSYPRHPKEACRSPRSACFGRFAARVLISLPAANVQPGRDLDRPQGAGERGVHARGESLAANGLKRAIELAHPWGVDACSRIESSATSFGLSST